MPRNNKQSDRERRLDFGRLLGGKAAPYFSSHEARSALLERKAHSHVVRDMHAAAAAADFTTPNYKFKFSHSCVAWCRIFCLARVIIFGHAALLSGCAAGLVANTHAGMQMNVLRCHTQFHLTECAGCPEKLITRTAGLCFFNWDRPWTAELFLGNLLHTRPRIYQSSIL